jgi:site-specific DNA-methyltransferase (adenine-specific)
MKLERNKSYKGDCIELMKFLPDESVDVICTDPPYLYLKNQKLDRPFDEEKYFSEAKRVLKKDGLIVLFGRGTSFYRWNTILSDLGFNFKEEVVWDKSYCSSPLMAMSRVHETVSIHTKGNGTINKVKVPYLEMKGHDIPSVCQDIKRMRSVFKNTKSLDAVLSFLENNKVPANTDHVLSTSISSIIKTQDVCASSLSRIRDGMNEKSIIKQGREHYNTIHPTQKPPRLLERLLALVSKEGDLVLDTFAGSCNLAKACINANRDYICMEIDEEYYNAGVENVKKHTRQLWYQSPLYENIVSK